MNLEKLISFYHYIYIPTQKNVNAPLYFLDFLEVVPYIKPGIDYICHIIKINSW